MIPSFVYNMGILTLKTPDAMNVCLKMLALTFILQFDNILFAQGISAETREHIEEHGRVEIDSQRVAQVTNFKSRAVTLVVCPTSILFTVRWVPWLELAGENIQVILTFIVYPMILSFVESKSFGQVCKACCHGFTGFIISFIVLTITTQV